MTGDAADDEIAAQLSMQDAIAVIRSGDLATAENLLAEASKNTSFRHRELKKFSEATHEVASEGIPTLQDREDLIHDHEVDIESWDEDIYEESVA